MGDSRRAASLGHSGLSALQFREPLWQGRRGAVVRRAAQAGPGQGQGQQALVCADRAAWSGPLCSVPCFDTSSNSTGSNRGSGSSVGAWPADFCRPDLQVGGGWWWGRGLIARWLLNLCDTNTHVHTPCVLTLASGAATRMRPAPRPHPGALLLTHPSANPCSPPRSALQVCVSGRCQDTLLRFALVVAAAQGSSTGLGAAGAASPSDPSLWESWDAVVADPAGRVLSARRPGALLAGGAGSAGAAASYDPSLGRVATGGGAGGVAQSVVWLPSQAPLEGTYHLCEWRDGCLREGGR